MSETRLRFPNDYDFIARTYGIRPRYGERVRHTISHHLGEGTVRRERRPGAYVSVQFDGQKRVSLCHARELIYLDRAEQETP